MLRNLKISLIRFNFANAKNKKLVVCAKKNWIFSLFACGRPLFEFINDVRCHLGVGLRYVGDTALCAVKATFYKLSGLGTLHV